MEYGDKKRSVDDVGKEADDGVMCDGNEGSSDISTRLKIYILRWLLKAMPI
jgi:hypothetical protein